MFSPMQQTNLLLLKKRTAMLILLTLFWISLSALNDMPVMAQFNGEHHASKFGFSMVSLDFNHDGIDDLAVCSPMYNYVYPGISDPARGKVYIYNGVNGFSSSTLPNITLIGTATNEAERVTGRRIWGLYRIGDVNGDGFDDLCVRIEDYGDCEKLLFFYGGTSDLDNPDHVINLTGNIYTFYSIHALGDINGDGFDDIGIEYMYVIPPQWQVRQSIIWGSTFEEHIVSAGEASPSYSSSINGIGDINNDGYDDFTTAFATPRIDPTHNIIRLYYGNAEGSTDDPITLINVQYGVSRGSKPLGDMNADGYDDFMGYITDSGMHIWLGGLDINFAEPCFNMDPPWYGGEFQRSLEHGDFNNDGYEDAVGAQYGLGCFSVWLGKHCVNGISDLIVNNGAYENFGYSLVTGDFNNDGFDDIAVAASHEYTPFPLGNFSGYVWIYAGNAQLADTTVANDDPAIPSVKEQLQLRISPNPIRRDDQLISIDLKHSTAVTPQPTSIEIYNIKGQSVLKEERIIQGKDNELQINPSSLKNGVYLCKITSGKQSAISRFSIVK